ncbi:MAG TPA: hypothetical protein P5528_11825 [Steroidobacteraceae bacterium]|nr:hypothetical protein [Steroidobacteraceae bacterium]HRX90121.1 hypothetical protein [Steroidobacteraceae bacterium]
MIGWAKSIGGWVLLAIGFAILLLPGPLGWPGLPVMAGGALLILSTSAKARRWFVEAAREEPKMFGRLRNWIRARRRRQHAGRRSAPPPPS